MNVVDGFVYWCIWDMVMWRGVASLVHVPESQWCEWQVECGAIVFVTFALSLLLARLLRLLL